MVSLNAYEGDGLTANVGLESLYVKLETSLKDTFVVIFPSDWISLFQGCTGAD